MMNRLDFLRCCAAASLLTSKGRGAAQDVPLLRGEVALPRQESTNVNSPWVQPGNASPQPIWGFRDGIQVSLWPASLEGGGEGGPRGLLRIGYPILQGGTKIGLVNFLAVEPMVKGQRSFSELERSATDDKPGRLFWSGEQDRFTASAMPASGTLSTVDGVQRLTWTVQTERFGNGARPILHLELHADQPGELRVKLFSAPDSAPMDFCVVTATMGNYMRLRQLWLQEGTVTAAKVWPGFNGKEFTPDAFYVRERLVRLPNGDLIVCATSDEADPHAVPPDPVAPGWAYRGSFPLTQYWLKPAAQHPETDLKVRVNGRRVYWATHNPIPGGLAYENFDLVEPFYEGQEFVFGLTRRLHAEIARGLTR